MVVIDNNVIEEECCGNCNNFKYACMLGGELHKRCDCKESECYNYLVADGNYCCKWEQEGD